MAPKLPYKAAQVVTQKFSQKVPAGEASDAAKMLSKYWEPAGDEVSRAVAADAYGGYGLDVSPPVDGVVASDWALQMENNADVGRSADHPLSTPIDRAVYDRARAADNVFDSYRRGVGPEPREADYAVSSRSTEVPRLLGAAATVGAGALALGAGSAQAEGFWTPERLAKFQAK